MPMFEGNWKCSSCGGAITQLPFQPRSESGLTCRDCYGKSKGGNNGGENGASSTVPTEPTMQSAPPPDDMPHFADTMAASEPMPPEDAFAGMEDAQPVTPGEKPKFSGDWSCAGCGAAITSLPFQPRNTENLKCLDCFKASK